LKVAILEQPAGAGNSRFTSKVARDTPSKARSPKFGCRRRWFCLPPAKGGAVHSDCKSREDLRKLVRCFQAGPFLEQPRTARCPANCRQPPRTRNSWGWGCNYPCLSTWKISKAKPLVTQCLSRLVRVLALVMVNWVKIPAGRSASMRR